MRRKCVCGAPTIDTHEIDNLIQVVDADPEPLPDDDDEPQLLVLVGDLDDNPLALWGVSPHGETMPWGTVIPAGAPRYRPHRH